MIFNSRSKHNEIFCYRTWSTGRSHIADGWPDQASAGGDPDNKEWTPTQDNSGFSDLVPEFEPGKPWKVKVITLRFRSHLCSFRIEHSP